MKKYILTLGAFFMMLISLTTFSNTNEEKVPNELIVNNPKKEVTTVESPKNREHGEMNISVTKINPIEIVGREVNGKLEFNLPEKVNSDNKILVTQDVSHIQGLVKLNGKEPRNLLGKKKIELPVPFTLEKKDEKTKVIVDKPKDKKDLYIAVMNGGKVEKVYKNMMISQKFATQLGEINIRLDARIKNEFSRNYSGILEFTIRNGGITGEIKFDRTGITVYKGSIEAGESLWVDDIIQSPQEAYIDTGRGRTRLTREFNGNDYFDAGSSDSRYNIRYYYKYGGQNLTTRQVFSPHSDYPGFLLKIPEHENKVTYIASLYYGSSNSYGEIPISIEYIGQQQPIEGTGTLDLSGLGVGYGIWWTNSKSGQGGKVPSSDSKYSINFSQGQLFRWISQMYHSYFDEGRFIIHSSKEGTKSVYGYGGTLRFTDNQFELTAGQLTIHKLSNSTEPITYRIQYYAGSAAISGEGKGNLYGTLNLTITNSVPPIQEYQIGDVDFKVDKRLKDANKGSWIFANGNVGPQISNNNVKNYSEMISVEREFNIGNNGNKNIADAEMNGRVKDSGSYISNNIKYIGFKKGNSWNLDAGAIPKDIILSQLKTSLVINKDNSTFNDNQFILKDSSGNKYIGNINENYIGSKTTTDARLNLTSLDSSGNEYLRWDDPNNSNSSFGSNNKRAQLEGGTFFNFKSAVKSERKHIVTKLVVQANGERETLVSDSENINTRLETDRFPDNKIGIDVNGGIFIHKKTENTNPIEYIIEGYYKDIKLGETRLTITNKVVKDIGYATFKVDKRLIDRRDKGNWIFANGDIKSRIMNGGVSGNYPELISIINSFSLGDFGQVQVMDSEMTDRQKDANNFVSDGITYKAFKKIGSSSWDYDAGAMPINITLNNLLNSIVIHKENKTLNDNKFLLKDNQNILYEGNIKESFEGESAKETVASLDLSSWNANNKEWGRWDNSSKLTTTIGASATLVGEGFFNWNSNVKNNGHIITKLKITEDDKQPIEINNDNINQKLQHDFTNNKIGIEQNGGIFIHKNTDSNTPITYVIEGYYKDIFLGKTTLTITNKKNSFELIGDDTLDFGKMIYDSYNPLYRAEKLFKVKNPGNLNLNFSVSKKTGVISKTGETSKQINLEDITVSKKNSRTSGETLFLLGASARVNKDTSPGNYTGEIQVIVDIDGTGSN